jgi:hypothetical protein
MAGRRERAFEIVFKDKVMLDQVSRPWIAKEDLSNLFM